MTLSNIFIQGIGIIGTILYFLSFQCKSNRNLFRVQFLSYVCYTSHLILLGAITGGLSYVINTLRSFCLSSENTFLKSKHMCIILCTLQICVLIFTWSGFISLLPVIANIATTIGGYTHNGIKIRFAGIFINSPLWIIYDIYVGSVAGLIDEIASETSMILSIYRFGIKDLNKVE